MNTITTPGNTHHVATRFTNSENVSRTVMSSQEIAELVGSRHDSVKRTIERLREKGVVSFTPSVETSHEGAGARPVEIYLVNKRDSFVVVAQLSPEFTAALVDRWQELEAQTGQFKIPATYAEALQAAADQAKDNQSLRLVILDQAPKVAAIKRLAAAGGSICITDAAKHLQVQPSRLFAWMEQHRWIFRRQGSGRWTAYQPRITSGYMIHKVTSLKANPETGAERAAFDPLVTPKGLAYLAEKNIGASL
jgi:phage regulator Rha-like protein